MRARDAFIIRSKGAWSLTARGKIYCAPPQNRDRESDRGKCGYLRMRDSSAESDTPVEQTVVLLNAARRFI